MPVNLLMLGDGGHVTNGVGRFVSDLKQQSIILK